MYRGSLMRDMFDQYFPFIFSPNRLFRTIQVAITKEEAPNLSDFQGIYWEDRKKSKLIKPLSKEGNPDNHEFPCKSWSEIFGYGWDPRAQSWTEFEEEMDKKFTIYKKLYKEATQRFMTDNGYVKTKEKRNYNHFMWLMRYQVQYWTLKKIAEEYSSENEILNELTISKGIKSAADIVMLTPRSSPIRSIEKTQR
jgi:hypothetical protein